MQRGCVLALVAMLAALAWSTPARAGGGPENVFLVVNATSPGSLAVANAYAALRGIPPINVLMLPWQGSREAVTISTFRTDILRPILQAIDSRKLSPQIDCVVYSTDFPWRIDFAEELPRELAGRDKFPSGSLTGMTMLYATVQAGSPEYLDPASNRYWRPVGTDGVPTTTVGFRGWYGWGPLGELLEAGGSRYLLSAVLGVTDGRGNTVPEILRYLRSAAAADGTRPQGTIYFLTNSDIRTTTRNPNNSVFPGVVAALEKLGVKAAAVKGTLPSGKRDIAGLMTGAADFDWPGSGCAVVPGAICENLTSFGGIFTPSAGQTPLSVFLRAGAAGSSGTVIEPFALQAKFPHASIQVHYARGASLVEAFYQSVRSPYQLLVVGDPLCRPWASIPVVEAVIAPDAKPVEPHAPLSGTVEFEPRATVPGGGSADRFELFVDGMRLAQCGLGERLTVDTTQLADGYHDLRLVAIESSPVESQGRWIMPVSFANNGRTLSLEVEPRRVKPSGTVRVSVSGTGLESVVIFAMGRVLGRTRESTSSVEVPAELLGRGSVTIQAIGRAGSGVSNSVNAVPVTVEVTDAG
ncbi:MAG: hypothetical protein KGR24_02135 [Planctomycetes bacterium]|nr:hypothetical protein [Planctomycetota bacterium]